MSVAAPVPAPPGAAGAIVPVRAGVSRLGVLRSASLLTLPELVMLPPVGPGAGLP
jgi:hypothetical protein